MTDIESLILAYCEDQSILPILQDALRDSIHGDKLWMSGYFKKTTFTPQDCINILAHCASKNIREKAQKQIRKQKRQPIQDFPVLTCLMKIWIT